MSWAGALSEALRGGGAMITQASIGDARRLHAPQSKRKHAARVGGIDDAVCRREQKSANTSHPRCTPRSVPSHRRAVE